VGINAIDGTGNGLANVLVGNIAANVLDGGDGADMMRGGRGDDTYLVDNAADLVLEQPGEGTDTVVASLSFALAENVENLTLTGRAITGTGNGLDNLMVGNTEANVLDGGAGADRMSGRGGDDIYIVDDVGDAVTENVGEGDDTVIASLSYTLGDNVEDLRLVGSADLAGSGNALSNVLEGNSGSNLLDGGGAADRMFGGAGDDTYVVDDAGDLATETAGDGNDTVLASVSYALSENVENLTLAGSADLSGFGNELDNHLTGNAGANLLDGAGGGDLMTGGAGDDSYVVDDVRDQVVEWFASGNDTVLAGIDYVLPQFVENLLLTGAALSGAGNELANTMYGNALDNLVDGGSSADSMMGGGGNDTYIVDDTGDTVHENAGEGADHVIASVSYTLSQKVENLTLVGSADLSATGNDLDNVIEGNDGANLIDGGAGADTLSGGAGDDRYMADDAADTVLEAQNAGIDTIVSSVSYRLSDNIENLVLTGDASWGAGNGLDNQLTGNAMDNLLDGAAGADRMAGGQGNDTYIVDHTGDVVAEAPGEGIDTVQTGVSYTLSDNVENLVLTGTDNIIGTGNALDNTMVGNSGNNALDGGLGNDLYVYQQGGGLDRITDAGGMDTVQFGAGLTLDKVALRIAFVGDQKIAQVRVLDAGGNEMPDQGFDYGMGSDAQNRLSSPIESFVFADGSRYEWSDLLIQSTTLNGTREDDLLIGGRNDDTMYGNRGDDAMYGGSGNDTLYGQDGSDVLHGFGGDDRLYGGDDDDELYGDAGNDQLFGESGDNYLLDHSGNNLFYGGNHKDVIQAGAGADQIDGGNDADLVDAGGGADAVQGGNGDDWIAAGQGNDTVDSGNGHNLLAFNRGDGVDTVTSNGRDVLSLGGGILYADLRLTKSGNDLILATGQGESVNLKDWYRGSKSKPVDVLQVITVGGEYDAASADKTRNRQVEVFDFTRVVQSFDAARARNASDSGNWAVMNSLLDAHLQGSDTAALGGDLSFQYGVSGSLAGIGLTAAQSMLGEGSATLQTLKPRSELEAATVRLS
jgi:Ca2+-binding RTX toxin-like protein